MDAEERPAKRTGQLTICEREGFFSPKLMRRYFEEAIKQTAVLAEMHPLHPEVCGNEFIEYLNPRTQAAWIGFAIGMRTAQRIAQAAAGVEAGEPRGPVHSCKNCAHLAKGSCDEPCASCTVRWRSGVSDRWEPANGVNSSLQSAASAETCRDGDGVKTGEGGGNGPAL